MANKQKEIIGQVITNLEIIKQEVGSYQQELADCSIAELTELKKTL